MPRLHLANTINVSAPYSPCKCNVSPISPVPMDLGAGGRDCTGTRSGRVGESRPGSAAALARLARDALRPIQPCVRSSRTRLADVLHRGHSAFMVPWLEGARRDDDSIEVDQPAVVRGLAGDAREESLLSRHDRLVPRELIERGGSPGA